MSCNDDQSFCRIDQTVGGNLKEIIDSYNDSELIDIVKNKTDNTYSLDFLTQLKNQSIDTKWWDILNKIFLAINAVGDYGDRNYPKVTDNQLDGFTQPQKNSLINADDYNQILNILRQSSNLSNISSKNINDIIFGTYFTDLKTYISEYNIDSNRCNDCNASCYASYSCNQSSGGDGCGCWCQYGEECYQGCGQSCSQDCNQSCYQSCSQCSGCNIGCYSGYSIPGCGSKEY